MHISLKNKTHENHPLHPPFSSTISILIIVSDLFNKKLSIYSGETLFHPKKNLARRGALNPREQTILKISLSRIGGKSGTDECSIQIHLDIHWVGMKRKEGRRVNGLTTSRVLFLPFLVDGIPIIIQFSRVLWWEKKGEKIRKKSGENVKE